MIDTRQYAIVDAHIHKPKNIGLADTYRAWATGFAAAHGSRGVEEAYRQQLFESPRVQSMLSYLAGVYGVEPRIDRIDEHVSRLMAGGFDKYVEDVMDREGIIHAVVDLSIEVSDPEQIADALHNLPSGRFSWTYNIVDMLQPEWAISKGVRDVAELVDTISKVLRQLSGIGCRGLKNSMAYYRRLGLSTVNEDRAEIAYKWLSKNGPEKHVNSFPRKVPEYISNEGRSHHITYQDFILRQIYIEAGRMGMPILFHVASALHPALTPINNDPRDLYTVFQDAEIVCAGTRFLILHGGYPLHREVATILSQNPNVYADTSFFSQYPAILEEMLTVFLQLAPYYKIMHGSDSNFFAEVMAYAAYNMRNSLGRILTRFERDWGWSSRHCNTVAEAVLGGNASKFFSIR